MKKILLLAVAMALSGCASSDAFKPQTQIQIITTTSYPVLPDIPEPQKPSLKPFRYDYPRGADGKPIPKSNIFVGVDQKNFNTLNRNMEVLKENNIQLRQRLKLANKQRAEWRKLSDEERIKVEEQRQKLISNPQKIILDGTEE